jgi:leucyl-tRNA synthetase
MRIVWDRVEGDLFYKGEGILVNSGKFNDLTTEDARRAIAEEFGVIKTQYRLRDWLISRQRYWGPPIPMIYCAACAANGKGERKGMPGWYAEQDKNLPVKLPMVKDFRPKGTGESPLASVRSFYEVKCPACKSKARRETDVSDTFLDSAWYYLRYPNIKERKRPWDPSVIKKWFPVDMYIGGSEHSVLHLLYVRFIALLLDDLKLVKFAAKKSAPKGEPFPYFRAHGLVIKDGAKMSKSKGNVINPDEYVEKFSADVLRMYLMFLAPFETGGDFRDEGILGIERFLASVRRYFEARQEAANFKKPSPSSARKALHKSIKKVTEDIESLKYNTAISQLMILFNALEAAKTEGYLDAKDAADALKLIAPFAPHLAEELWHSDLCQASSIHIASWPKWNSKFMREETFTLIVQINGKVRASIAAPTGILEAEAGELALQDPRIKDLLQGQEPQRIIYVPGRLVNIVV